MTSYFYRKYMVDSENGVRNISFLIRFCLKRVQSTIFKDFKNLTLTITYLSIFIYKNILFK